MSDEKEPTNITRFPTPEGASMLTPPEVQQIDLSMLFQMIGEREVQLHVLRANVATLRAAMERLTARPKREKTTPVVDPEDPSS